MVTWRPISRLQPDISERGFYTWTQDLQTPCNAQSSAIFELVTDVILRLLPRGSAAPLITIVTKSWKSRPPLCLLRHHSTHTTKKTMHC
jgi:hypothetical protein